MAVKVDDPRDVQSAYDERFNQLRGAEQTPSQSYSDAGIDQAEAFANDPANHNDYGDDVRDKEATAGSWENNVTGGQSGKSQGGLRGLGKKAQVIFKKKGATAAIIALLGGGAAVPFFGAASLPFSIVGNMDAKSMMQGLEQYSEDYIGFNIFTNKSSVSSTANKIRGLRDTEIEQLKANGVELNEPTKSSLSGKTTFKSVTFEGQTYRAGTEFNNAMRTNTAFRNAMVFNKGSYWKSAKSSFASKVKSLFKIDPDPDISGKTVKEEDAKLFNEAVEGIDSQADSAGTQEEKDKQTGEDPNAA